MQSDNTGKKQLRFRNSIMMRISLIIITVEIIILLFTGLFFIRNFNEEIENRYTLYAELPGRLIQSGELNYDILNNRILMNRLTGLDFIEGMVLDDNLDVIASLNPLHTGMNIEEMSSIDPGWFTYLHQDNIGFTISQGSGSYYINITPLTAMDGINVKGWVFIKLNINTMINEKKNNVRILFIGMAATLLLTSFVLISVFVFFFASRINNTVDTLIRIQGNHLSDRVGRIFMNDEISFLQIKINEMLDSLENTINYLNTEIEEKEIIAANQEKLITEKENLIHELFHRTRNNLQLVNSMIDIQTSYCGEAETVKVLKETNNRIYSIVLVNQRLFEANKLSEVNLKEYVLDLCNHYLYSNPEKQTEITYKFEMDDIPTHIDTAMPFGLVINELLANSYEHAFKNTEKGEIFISLKNNKDNNVEVYIKDNGRNTPINFNLNDSGKMGLNNALMLVEYQLGGKIYFETAGGFGCRFVFKNPEITPRIKKETAQ